MKKYLLVLGIFFIGNNTINAQFYSDLNFNINDSLKLVASTNSNYKKVDILINIGWRYIYSNGDTAIKYFKISDEIAFKSKEELQLRRVYNNIAAAYNQTIGNYPLGLHYGTEALKLGNKLNLSDSLMRNTYFHLGQCYAYLHNKDLALKYLIY